MGNAQFKLLFPSHAMPFTIPNTEIPNIVSKINLMLKDMEKKGVTKASGFRIPAADGSGDIVVDMPTSGDWILVDVDYSTVIHEAFAPKMVRAGGTYMVLPMKAAGLKAVDLKTACARGAAGPSSSPSSPPPPPYGPAKATTANV